MEDIYIRLTRHLKDLIMGYPFNDALVDLLKEMFGPTEAKVALTIPNSLLPLEVVDIKSIAPRSDLPGSTVTEALESLSGRNMLYTAKTEDGAPGYSLLQVGYGMPQSFFWGGKRDETAKRMAGLVRKYFTVPIRQEVYGSVTTKTNKYSPANLAVDVAHAGCPAS